ncbi:C40 family peptidase [Cryobacterium roopkundense]|uniref:Cell wall-associated NlpC family hydrolase n=1 Tax=Cryobacterium roopkundense TaxID=1001240 RepID=A0A7W8ZVS2_9MICO|nr:C40 family peptidase [Cryobacterium roopkundense]MBB5640820.1 cell wall-associated NlpC family hydrolase [Cryobacterium roopkundense]
MTMSDALSRIDQIQSTLQRIAGTQSPAKTAASAASADAFAATLASSLGTTGTSASGVAALAGTSTATGTDVATAAQKYLGVPYVFGGEDASGMDCSGLVQKVYADVGIEVPRLVSGQMKLGTEVGSLAEAQPGDLIVTGGGAHILIYAGNNKVIHAPYAGRTVCLVEAYMTDADIDTIRRVIPTQTAATAGNTTADMFSAALASFESGGAR